MDAPGLCNAGEWSASTTLVQRRQLELCIPPLLPRRREGGWLWKTRSVFQGVWEGAGGRGGGGSLPHPGRPPAGVMGVRGKRGLFPQKPAEFPPVSPQEASVLPERRCWAASAR
jgi:hypothetical protein